jgi:hypothetical protein
MEVFEAFWSLNSHGCFIVRSRAGWVTAVDSLEFPSSLDANKLWVIKDEKVWETKFSNEDRTQYPFKLEKVARDGPKWGPKIQVDVVVRLVDRERKTYFLKASDQWIGRTD